jgi:hypothetical protein
MLFMKIVLTESQRLIHFVLHFYSHHVKYCTSDLLSICFTKIYSMKSQNEYSLLKYCFTKTAMQFVAMKLKLPNLNLHKMQLILLK